MSNSHVDRRAGRDVVRLAHLVLEFGLSNFIIFHKFIFFFQSSYFLFKIAVFQREVDFFSNTCIFLWNFTSYDFYLLIHREQSSVMSLLHSDERDSGLIASFQHHARLSHRSQLVLENLNMWKLAHFQECSMFDFYIEELSLGHSVSVDDNSRRLESSVAVELDEQLADHVGQIRDDLLAMLLDSHCGCVAGKGQQYL